MTVDPTILTSPPFPWFGGKRKVSDLVWRYLGDVDLYCEPFAGSLAVLFGRPTPPKTETVNDIDMYIVNFWRAVKHAPDEVAYHANNPVNEADLTARHIWLVQNKDERLARLQGDPDFYDAKVAGWWVWGISCWIGSEWCAGTGPWSSRDGKLINLRDENQNGEGVKKQRVQLGNGRGVNKQLVHLGSSGQGVNKQRMHSDAKSRGASTGEAEIAEYLNHFAERLRYVRVCCGDWTRVVTAGALAHGNSVGIFLDPPYDLKVRGNDLYNTDRENGNISAEVREWAIENANNPRYRIVLAGYEGEHEMPPDWRVVSWTAGRSYGRSSGETQNSKNRKKERLWISPNCLNGENGQTDETQALLWETK